MAIISSPAQSTPNFLFYFDNIWGYCFNSQILGVFGAEYNCQRLKISRPICPVLYIPAHRSGTPQSEGRMPKMGANYYWSKYIILIYNQYYGF
jgi:hypothetical protein